VSGFGPPVGVGVGGRNKVCSGCGIEDGRSFQWRKGVMLQGASVHIVINKSLRILRHV